jgi:hypothetical protein
VEPVGGADSYLLLPEAQEFFVLASRQVAVAD